MYTWSVAVLTLTTIIESVFAPVTMPAGAARVESEQQHVQPAVVLGVDLGDVKGWAGAGLDGGGWLGRVRDVIIAVIARVGRGVKVDPGGRPLGLGSWAIWPFDETGACVGPMWLQSSIVQSTPLVRPGSAREMRYAQLAAVQRSREDDDD